MKVQLRICTVIDLTANGYEVTFSKRFYFNFNFNGGGIQFPICNTKHFENLQEHCSKGSVDNLLAFTGLFLIIVCTNARN